MSKGIKYDIENNPNRARIYGWHSRQAPRVKDLSVGAEDVDVKKITSKVTYDSWSKKYDSKYKIGFEIEKNTIGDYYRREYALVKGYERDISCGVERGINGHEAITNILPLVPNSLWRMKVYDLIFKAKGIMNDSSSPSNYRCGGHITVSVKGLDADELLQKVRLNASILMAIFTKRLKNNYCKYNLRMQDGFDHGVDYFNGWDNKYQLALVKRGGLLEFRLPNRVSSHKSLFRRYEMMYEIIDFSIEKPNGNFNTLLNKVKPIMLAMYDGDVDKVSDRLKWAKHFRKFVLDGTIHQSIRDFIK